MSTNSMPNPAFSLVVLCYKAEEAIIPFVQKVHTLLSWVKIDYELILVGNYWPEQNDKTPAIVQNLAQTLPRTRCVTMPKQGYMGWDLKTGFQAARGDYIGFIDGDGQFPIDSILPLIYHSLTNNYDLTKTYRVARGDGPLRILISSVFNMLFSLLFGTHYRDANSKPKIMKKELLQSMNLQSDDWFIDAEIMIKAHRAHAKVIEIPIHFVENEQRASFVKPGAVLEFLKNLYRFRFKNQ